MGIEGTYDTLPESEKPLRRLHSRRLAPKFALLFALCCTLYAISSHVPNCLRKRSNAPGSITWVPCPKSQREVVDCGIMTVPKDYFDELAGTASIAFVRIKATDLPKKGSVMLNPGGPGGSGMMWALARSDMIKGYVGGSYDLIGFDPRGIGLTEPKTRCFSSNEDYRLFMANTILEQGFTIPSSHNVTSPETRDMLVRQNREFLALKESQAALCAKNMGDELKYMGTANVVRDMDLMTKVLEGPEAKINYWGGSYGSILGTYLVNMLPDRVGYVTIDGIADPVSWSNEPSHKWHTGWVSSAERTYEMFLNDCSQAGPKFCPLTEHTNEPITNIERRIENFLDELVLKPLPVPHALRPGYLTSGSARALILSMLERPAQWPLGSHALHSAMSGNGTALYNAIVHPESWYSTDLARLAVTCMDSPPPPSSKENPTAEDLADEIVHALDKVSRHFGASVSLGEQDGGCQFWPTRGKGPERFTGPWNATLETPMLIVSNTHDPITPIASGLLVNSLMPNSSTLLIQNGPGHCSSSMASLCTMKHVREYFTSGTIPANGTRCDVDAATFPGPDASGARILPKKDLELLALMKEYEEELARRRFGL